MTEVMDDLLAFLRARLDDEERAAQEATPGPWHLDTNSIMHSGPSTSASNERWGQCVVASVGAYDGGRPTAADAEHIAYWDPERALAEVNAKRRILDELERWQGRDLPEGVAEGRDWNEIERDEMVRDVLTSVVEAFAQAYASHPSFRSEWKIQ